MSGESLVLETVTTGLGIVVVVAGGMTLFLSWRDGLKEEHRKNEKKISKINLHRYGMFPKK